MNPHLHFRSGSILFLLVVLTLCLTALQAPPPTGVGSGTIDVLVVSPTSAPVAGITVWYLDEWERAPYASCTTDAQGTCVLVITDAPTLGTMLRGVVDVGSGRVQDAMLMVGERVTVRVTVDARGDVQVDTDVLATRDPRVTPTMLSVESAFATLTAMAAEPIATPAPGIERTVAAAHTAMTATTVARSMTPTPAATVTPTATVPALTLAAPALPSPTSGTDVQSLEATPASPFGGEDWIPLLLVILAGGALLVVAWGVWGRPRGGQA